MNKKILIIVAVAVVGVLALGAIGLGVAYAQDPTPNSPFTPRGMMGGAWRQGGDSSPMDAMHNWMTASSGMHTLVWNALADALGLTPDELTAELNSGKTLAALGEEKGLDRATLVTELEKAHQAGLSQAVADGILTQEQADAMQTQMAGRYEWMLDNMGAGAGYGRMGGRRGGMMGRFSNQQNGDGQFTPGGCHGAFAPTAPQSNP